MHPSSLQLIEILPLELLLILAVDRSSPQQSSVPCSIRNRYFPAVNLRSGPRYSRPSYVIGWQVLRQEMEIGVAEISHRGGCGTLKNVGRGGKMPQSRDEMIDSGV